MRSISLWVTTVSVGLLAMVACAPTLSPPSPPIDPGTGRPIRFPINNDGGTAGGTTNGLKPEIYYSNTDRLNDLMTRTLGAAAADGAKWPVKGLTLPGAPPGTAGLDPATLAQLELDDALLLSDIIGCSEPLNKTWTMPGYVPVYGEGLMKVPDWATVALGPFPRPSGPTPPPIPAVDVHTCLVARLNAYGRVVPIWLMGPDVIKSASGPGRFTYREAVFLAIPDFTLAAKPKVRLYAMPLDGLTTSCNYSPEKAIQWRVCGRLAKGLRASDVNECNVQPMVAEGQPNPNNLPVCKQVLTPDGTRIVDGSWTCTVPAPDTSHMQTYAAIETRLDPSDWSLIYGCESGLSCTPPPTASSAIPSPAPARP